MKYVGIWLIVGAGMGLGRFYSRRLYRRARRLQEIVRLLEALVQRLTYTALPLTQLWRQLAAGEAFQDVPLAQVTAEKLKEHPFFEAYTAGVDSMAGDGLTAADRQLLLEFGEGCGRTGLAEQAAHIRAYQRLLEQAQQEAQQRAATQGAVYQMLGLAGGVALALLLL